MKELLLGVRNADTNSKVAAFAVRGLTDADRKSGHFTSVDDLSHGSGSELIVENILAKTKDATGFLVQPDVETIRNKKVDVVLFVTDTVGSGSEANEFMSFFAANSSVRSWLSSKHVRFELATHSISEFAWSWFKGDRRWGAIHLIQPGSDFASSGWSSDQRTRIETLCAKYSDGLSNNLGYAGVSHLTVFGHTVGNGLPRILLQRKGPNKTHWIPLLPFDRAYGLDFDGELETADYRYPHTAETMVESFRQSPTPRKLQAQEQLAIATSSANALSPIILFLVCLRLGIQGDFQIMRHAKMTQRRLKEIRKYSEDMALITAGDHLTESGRELIRKFGRKSVQLVSSIHREANDPYYPSQLR
jgi:hypothetical protein